MKFSTNTDIEAPIEAVFEMFCDFESFERAAMRRGAEVQRTDTLPQPGVGMTWRAGFEMRGKPRQVDLEMTSFERPNEIRLAGTSPGMRSVTQFELISLSRNSTRVHVTLEVTPQNLSARLLVQSLKLAKSNLTKRFKLKVADYAKLVEDRHARAT